MYCIPDTTSCHEKVTTALQLGLLNPKLSLEVKLCEFHGRYKKEDLLKGEINFESSEKDS